jgi:serine/threonine protein phosphatase PrpC
MLFCYRKSRESNNCYVLDVSFLTDPGCEREGNEDCISYHQPSKLTLYQKKGVLAVIADGMGGHRAGDVASKKAVAVVQRVYFSKSRATTVALKAAFKAANREIYKLSHSDKAYQGMGTTCTALVVKGPFAYYAHVGDTRLYLVRGNNIFLMTEDHTLVRELVKLGLISDKEERQHPDKNVVSRALGTSKNICVSIWEKPLPLYEGDTFILCSDGLHDLVENEELRQIASSDNLHAACQGLIDLAKERGGHDNITVGLVRVKSASGV